MGIWCQSVIGRLWFLCIVTIHMEPSSLDGIQMLSFLCQCQCQYSDINTIFKKNNGRIRLSIIEKLVVLTV